MLKYYEINNLIYDLAQRFKDPLKMRAFMLDQKNANPDPLSPSPPSWRDLSLAGGYPSLLLFYATLNKHGLLENADAIIHRYVLEIKKAIEKESFLPLSLFDGVSGICFALKQAACDGKKYQPMISSLDQFLVTKVREMYLKPLYHSISQAIPMSSVIYDIISGICGIGRYLLEYLSSPYFIELIQEIVRILSKMTNHLIIDGNYVPAWYLMPNDPLNGKSNMNEAKGNFNLGLAHGVTGILAFLAICSLKGIEVEGQKQAMTYMANWICDRSFLKNKSIRWSYVVTWEEEISKKPFLEKPAKDAWCYGVPGITRTLLLAGRALQDKKLQEFATTAFKNIFSRTKDNWELIGPCLCHGISGLLLITNEMAKEEDGKHLSRQVDNLLEILISYHDPKLPFGFADIEPCKQGSNIPVNKLGLLNGVEGILLTLLSLNKPITGWSLPFFINS